MKILHFADLHLGVENYGRIDPATGLSSRLLDFLAALDHVVDYALENRVDLVLFCGDAYKSREPSQTQQREFARRINHLSTSGIPIFLLVGNHDLPNAIGKATTADIFDTLAVKNVYVSNHPDVYRIPTRSGVVQVASLPWLRRSALLSKEETKSLDFGQINQRLQEVLTNIIAAHVLKLDPKIPSILAGHVWVTGAQYGSERIMTIGQEHVLLPGTMANPAFDYVALGHIHKRQVLFAKPPVVYAGSLNRLDFSEEEDEKGFYLVDIGPGESPEKRQVSFTFHTVDSRPFLTIKVDIKSDDVNPTTTVLQVLAEKRESIKGAIVRLQLILPAEVEGQLRTSDIKNALGEAYYFTIARDIERESRLRLGQRSVDGVTPLDALKTYLEANYPAAQAKVLLEYGKRLIEDRMAEL